MVQWAKIYYPYLVSDQHTKTFSFLTFFLAAENEKVGDDEKVDDE
jgi:hypothetical protein